MPQTTQHCLIHILLLWTTIVSIIQIVLFILFFTAGHNGLSQNSSAVEAQHKMQSQEQNITPKPSDDNPFLGKMLTFKAANVNTAIKWISKSRNPGVVSENEDDLLIMKDGYYFLNLRVTLSSCRESDGTSEHTVSLKWTNNANNTCSLLVGWINTKTNSTGMLSKVEQLSAGGKLKLDISPLTKCVNESESVTHLDIIYMVKP